MKNVKNITKKQLVEKIHELERELDELKTKKSAKVETGDFIKIERETVLKIGSNLSVALSKISMMNSVQTTESSNRQLLLETDRIIAIAHDQLDTVMLKQMSAEKDVKCVR